MGCGDHWPRCDGQWFPPLDLPTLIEIGHRWAAALVSLLVFAVAAVAWRRHRAEPALRQPATLAAVLLVVQVLLGAVTVKLALPPWVIITHLANAMLLLAALMVVALRAGLRRTRRPAGARAPPGARPGSGHGGAGVRGDPVRRRRWPTSTPACSASASRCARTACCPPASALGALHWTHRVLAFAFLGLTLVMVSRVSRRRRSGRPDGSGGRRGWSWRPRWRRSRSRPPWYSTCCRPRSGRCTCCVGTLVWAALVRAGLPVAPDAAPVAAESEAGSQGQRPSLAADLVTLTKPRIISLLLVTTIAPMFITPAGLPTLEPGVLGARGRLPDGRRRQRHQHVVRPGHRHPDGADPASADSGRAGSRRGSGSPSASALGLAAFAVFWYRVNPLSAWLALGGLLFYVFIYTIWLKRTSPQNIVIGGAAGAFPPLVGWAAMTGRLDLAAIYLFAIIFYWTPPHFWALALIKQADYARAGIPMMPVVRGEARTKYEMLVYTLMLLPLTIMPTLFGALGLFYGVAAAILGARLLWYCIRLLRERSVTPVAWQMYRYSLLYLALLFVAMGIDRALPFGRPAPAAQGDHPGRTRAAGGDAGRRARASLNGLRTFTAEHREDAGTGHASPS